MYSPQRSKRDDNHEEIVNIIKNIPGIRYQEVHMVPEFGCDVIFMLRQRLYLVEIKDGSKPPSARKLTIMEEVAREYWGENYHVVESKEDIIKLLEMRLS